MPIGISNKIRIAALPVLLAGAMIGAEGYKDVQKLARLDKEGVTVDGLIDTSMSVSQRSDSQGESYQGESFDVTYTPLHEKTVTESFSVTPEFFRWQVQGDDVTNPAVKVRYFGGHSSEQRIIVGGSSDRTLLFQAGAGLVVVGVAGMVGSFFIRRPN